MRRLMQMAAGLTLAAALFGQAVFQQASATIANGESLSAAVALGSGVPVAILMPGSWTAASLTFQCSADNATYGNVYDDGGNELTVTTAASRFVVLPAALFAGCRYAKVRSGTAGSPTNQGAARVLVLITRR